MDSHLIEGARAFAAVAAGLGIGYAFGLVQINARRENEQKQRAGTFNSAWAAMPGSGKRVAGLIIVLALIQLVCPMLFRGGVEWWISGGVVVGYGGMLYRQLRARMAGQL